MKNPSKTPATPERSDAFAWMRQIEELMALPVKGRPAVTIVGDDDVTGFDPTPSAVIYTNP